MAEYKIADNEETARRALDVIAILNDALDSLTQTGSVDVGADKQRVFYVAYGWWASITRSSRAVAMLYEAGLGHEAGPIVRTILQHTLALHWLVDVGDDALDAVAEYGDDNTRLLLKTMADAKWLLPDGVDATAPPEPAEPHPLKNKIKVFEQLCIAYDARTLYVPYRLLSAQIHPSPSGANAYIDLASEELLGNAKSESYGQLIDTARSLIQAGHVIGPLLEQDTIREAVARAEDRLGVRFGLWTRKTKAQKNRKPTMGA